MNYYVLRPDLTPYEGITVTKDTDIKYENEKVKQTIKNLKMISEFTEKKERYSSYSKLEINLEEGDILLFENENRGYFLPSNVQIATISDAIKDYEALASALDGDNNDSQRNEN